jgi:hypothetical protein
MGQTQSTTSQELEKVITSHLSILPMTHERCMSDYSLILASELSKLSRVKIVGMSEDVLFVPNKPAVHGKSSFMTKKDMCNQLASHYTEARLILERISKAQTLWSSVENCVKLESGKAREVSYVECSENEISNLPGFPEYTSGLAKDQKNAILFQIRDLSSPEFNACGDSLFTPAEYSTMFGKSRQKSASSCRTHKESLYLADFEFENTKVFTPIFAAKQQKKQKLYRPEVPSEIRELRKKFEKMKVQHKVSLQRMSKVVGSLVDGDEFRKLTREKLDEVKHEANRTLAKFYLETLRDYRDLVTKK